MVVKSGAASESERPLSLDTTKDKLYNHGSGSRSACPRRGMMLMESWDRRRGLVATNCNSWRCISCRERNLNRFKAVVSHGVSILTECLFITITYKAGAKRLSRAQSVAKDWRAFWRLSHKRYPETKLWGVIRVMEVTKKGTPHMHLLVGKVIGRKRCYGSSFRIKPFLAVFEECECWSHRLSRIWKQVQKGESFIVHTLPVSSAKGAGAYLGKYMMKAYDPELARELGMSRRFSANSRWPREKRRRLVPGGTDGWRRTTWDPRQVDTSQWLGLTEFQCDASKEQIVRDEKRAARALLKSFGREIG